MDASLVKNIRAAIKKAKQQNKKSKPEENKTAPVKTIKYPNLIPTRPEKQCRGKKKYTNYESAKRGAFNVWVFDEEIPVGGIHAYQCPECKFFHVGKVPRRFNK